MAIEPFVGEIMVVAFDFPPRGWAFCNGQILSIAQNGALYSEIDTTYGGDGIATFALPDLRGRAPLHSGARTNLPKFALGEKAEGARLKASDAADAPVATPTLVLNYVIALRGRRPLRDGQNDSRHVETDPFLGQLMLVPYKDKAPKGWAFCDGQVLSIERHTALFQALGFNYGSFGKVDFVLPDLIGRAPLHSVAGEDLPKVDLGGTGGGEKVQGVDAPTGPMTTPILAMNWIIALHGELPDRP